LTYRIPCKCGKLRQFGLFSSYIYRRRAHYATVSDYLLLCLHLGGIVAAASDSDYSYTFLRSTV